MHRLLGRHIYIVNLGKCVARAGGADAFVSRCHDTRLNGIWIRLGYGLNLDRNLKLAAYRSLRKKLRDLGIEIWGWHLPRCPNLDRARREAGLVARWAADYELDGVLLDAESEAAFFQGGSTEAESYTGLVRAGLSALGKGLVLSSHDQPRNFPDFPFGAFLDGVEDNSPQVYYQKDAPTRLAKSAAQYKALEVSRDFTDRYKPVGNVTVTGDVPLADAAACVAEALAFIRAVTQEGYKAYGFWCWDEAPDEIWKALQNTEVFPAGGGLVDAIGRAPESGDEVAEADLVSIAGEVQVLLTLPDAERTGFYDSVLSEPLDELAMRVRDGLDAASLARWLQIQALTMDLAVESASDVTFHLWQSAPELVRAAASGLPPEQRTRIEWLLREFAGEEMVTAVQSFPVVRGLDAIVHAKLAGAFDATGSFRSTRGFPVVSGTLSLLDPQGVALGTYAANTGGGARDSRSRNGPIPPGTYRVSNHRSNRITTGMVFDGVGFSFDLDPVGGTAVYGRKLFRIHPDGGSPGTNGCLGLRESAARLREAEAILVRLLADSSDACQISVRHSL